MRNPHWPSTARRRLWTLAATAILLISVQSFAASADDPLTQVHDGLNQVIAIFHKKDASLAARREQLRNLAEQHFDFTDMAKSVLGYHWRALTPAQRADFVPLFTGFIESAFLSKLQDYTVQKIRQETQAAKIDYLRESFDGLTYVEVFTDITVPEQKEPLHINYLMHHIDGSWRIYDISVDAISIMANYRNQFDRVINNQGYDQLVAIMKEKQKQIREHMENPGQAAAGS